MRIGVSTASMFTRKETENALLYLSENKVNSAEVFLSTYSEYTEDFADLLNRKNVENIRINSIHTLNTQFEPQLYSINPRAKDDAFKILERVLKVAEKIGAENYTFHGVARLKKTPITINFDRVGEVTNEIIARCENHGVTLSYENVHWAYYNYIGFFTELKKRCPKLKGVLDIKQAKQSGISEFEYINDMSGSIVTAHLSDTDKEGKLCLPGKGTYDFKALFLALKASGFNGDALIEVYQENYSEIGEILASAKYLENLKSQIF